MIFIYKFILTINILLITFGVLFKIMHWPYGQDLVYLGYVAGFVNAIIGIYFMYHSNELDMLSKILWALCLLLFGWLGGLFFYYKILKTNKLDAA